MPRMLTVITHEDGVSGANYLRDILGALARRMLFPQLEYACEHCGSTMRANIPIFACVFCGKKIHPGKASRMPYEAWEIRFGKHIQQFGKPSLERIRKILERGHWVVKPGD